MAYAFRGAARCGLAALLLGGGVVTAEAQTVVGEVLDAAASNPLRGVFVRLLDDRGAFRAGMLTDSLGTFALRAPAAGTYRVSAEQLGYAALALDSVELAPGRAQRLTLRLTPQAVRLDSIAATARTQCRIRPESGANTQELWLQIRKALDVAVWGARSNQLRYTIATFRRTLDRNGRASARARPDTALGTGPRPFFTPPPQDLTTTGFIRPGQAVDEYTYYAPDAEVLVSDPFLATHCFWVRPSPKDHDDWLGLAFEPVPDRTVSDIAGVLWVDRHNGELTQLDYEYTRLPWHMPDGLAGGRVAFRRTPGGAWIIQSWSIRIPRVQAAPPTIGRYAQRAGYQFVGFAEAGGDVRDLRTLEGLRVPGVHTAAALGVIFDSTNLAPLAGARVLIEGSTVETRTDLAGRYQLEEIPAGEHEIAVEHPRLASLSVELGAKGVRFTSGEWIRRDFAVPSLGSLLAARCAAQGATGSTLAGYVRDTLAGGGVADARVTATWQSDTGMARTAAVTDSAGLYLVCGAPPNATITLEATRWPWERSTVRVALAGRAGMQADIPFATVAAAELIGVELDTSAIRLRPIEVHAKARALPKFEAVRQRQQELTKLGLGQFLWRKDFEKQSPSRLTDVLRGLRGIIIVPYVDDRGSIVGQYIVRTTRNLRFTRNPCRVQLYVDGVRLTATSGPEEPFDLIVPLTTVEVIEVYTSAAEVPHEYGGSNFGCGVVAVWTRAGPDR